MRLTLYTILYSPQTPKDTLISRSDQHSRVSTAHERPKRAARPSVLDSLLGTQLDAPGHGLHGLYDGALHGARRLRDLLEDRRARHRAPGIALASCKTLANHSPTAVWITHRLQFARCFLASALAARLKATQRTNCATAPRLSTEALSSTTQCSKQHGCAPSSYPPAAGGRGPRHGCGANEAKIKGARLGDGRIGWAW